MYLQALHAPEDCRCAWQTAGLRSPCSGRGSSVKIKSLGRMKIKEIKNFGGLILFCIEADFYVQIRILQHFSRSTVAPIGRKKSARTFLPAKKKRTFGREPGRLGRPMGYQRLTYGEPTGDVGVTSGQPGVTSLAISAGFWLVFKDSPKKRRDRRHFFYEMFDFLSRKRHSRARGWS